MHIMDKQSRNGDNVNDVNEVQQENFVAVSDHPKKEEKCGYDTGKRHDGDGGRDAAAVSASDGDGAIRSTSKVFRYASAESEPGAFRVDPPLPSLSAQGGISGRQR